MMRRCNNLDRNQDMMHAWSLHKCYWPARKLKPQGYVRRHSGPRAPYVKSGIELGSTCSRESVRTSASGQT